MEAIDLRDYLSKYRTFIMGMAMISIILFHQVQFDTGVFSFFHKFGHLGVDLFLLVSGYGISRSLESNSLKVYFRNRLVRIFPTCIFLGIINSLILLSWGEYSSSIRVMCWRPFSFDIWFIQAIVIYYLLAPGLSYIGRSVGMSYVLYFVVLLIFTIMPTSLFCDYHPLDWTWGRLPAFLTGMLWFQTRSFHMNYSWGMIGVIALGIIFYFNGAIYYQFILAMPLVIYVLGKLAVLAQKIHIDGFLCFFGKYSLEILIGRCIVYVVLKHYFDVKSSGIYFVIEVVGFILLAYATKKIVNLLPFVSKRS